MIKVFPVLTDFAETAFIQRYLFNNHFRGQNILAKKHFSEIILTQNVFSTRGMKRQFIKTNIFLG